MSGFRALAVLAWRESRFARRRLLLFLSSISLGVAALVATQSFAANLAQGVRDQSRAMLGADLALSSNRKFGPETSYARRRTPPPPVGVAPARPRPTRGRGAGARRERLHARHRHH